MLSARCSLVVCKAFDQANLCLLFFLGVAAMIPTRFRCVCQAERMIFVIRYFAGYHILMVAHIEDPPGIIVGQFGGELFERVV